MNYSHTQYAPLHYLLHAIGIVLLIGAWLARADLPIFIILATSAFLLFLFGLTFANLTVRDEGDFLQLEYGPLPFFRHQIRYAEIRSLEPSRSTFIDGWGIHWIPGRGWTYNLWGFDCAKLDVDGKTVRIGSDDVENLVMFLQSKTKPPARNS